MRYLVYECKALGRAANAKFGLYLYLDFEYSINTINIVNTLLSRTIGEGYLGRTMLAAATVVVSASSIFAQTQAVKGVVRDAKNEPLIGVNVRVKGTAQGTVTDLDGNFSLNAPKGATLVFSYVGYQEQSVVLSGTAPLAIVLQEDAKTLDAVVVTALGIKRSTKALSYNVQEMKSDALTTVKDANFMNALSGKVAGVNINASSSGVGGATRVVMRGPKSLNQSNQALYVIDGVPMFNSNGGAAEGMYASQPKGEGISDINPDDIESMSVLSGPAAAALYGSSAAQGVIMITTKKGKEGKVNVMLSNSTSFSNPFVMPKFQSEYVNNLGDVRSWGNKQASRFGAYDPADFFNTGTSIQNTASLTVGSEKSQTYLSVGTSNATGIIPNSAYDKYTFTFRNTTKFLNDKLTLDFGFNYVKQNDKNLMAQGQYFNPLVPLYLFPRGENFEAVRTFEVWDPVRKIYTQNWNYGDDYKMQNPYWVAHRMNRTNDKNRYMANLNLKYQVLSWLDVTGRVRADISNNHSEDKRHATTLSIFTGSEYGFYGYTKGQDAAVYADLMANVNKTFGDDLSLSGNFGISTNRTFSESTGFAAGLRSISNFFTPLEQDYGTPTQGNRPSYYDHRHITNSVFASAELGYKRMLYLTLTGRTDWDSALAYTSSNPFFYPSVGLSGIVSEMVKLPKWFDYLKVRGSWAKVGSPIPAHLSSPYRYTYDPANQSYATVTYKFPDQFKPEMTTSWEAGVTAKFFKNKLSIDATVYQSNTHNQTFTIPYTEEPGFSARYIQAGDVRNRGIELSVGLNNQFGKDFEWNTTITFSANENRIIDSGSDSPIGRGGLNGANIYTQTGGSMGDVYVDKAIKRDREGYPILDALGNVVVESVPAYYVGSVLPDANLGWRNDFTYKGFNFGFLITARLGGIVLSQTQAILDSYGVSEATAIARNNGGIDFNAGKVDAQTFYTAVGGDSPLWSEYIYSATNVRLQEAFISYSLPKKWFKNKVGVSLGLTARNLLMIYNKAPFDPEVTASTGTYYQGFDYFMQPSLRNFGFNIKVQF